MSIDRAWRLWRVANLQVPRKRRRPAGSRPRPRAPEQPRHIWAYDLVFYRCANGHVLKCLTIVDENTRECLAIDVAGRIRSAQVIDQLARLISLHGAPTCLRSDRGREIVSRAILNWLLDRNFDTALIDPWKPWQNGLDESFNGKFCDECSNMEWFRSRAEAKVVIETWRRQCNHVRPHSSLNYLTLSQFIHRLPERVSKQAVLWMRLVRRSQAGEIASTNGTH